MCYSELVEILKLRYYVIFHYDSKNFFFRLLKTLCTILFIIPFAVVSSFNFLIDLIMFIPTKIPFIKIFAKFICKLCDYVTWLIFSLIMLSDRLYNTKFYQMTKISSDKKEKSE